MTIHPTPHSAFTQAVEYRPHDMGRFLRGDYVLINGEPYRVQVAKSWPPWGPGVLTLHLRSGRKLIYGEKHGVPSWLVGLLLSGSTGMAYNRLVKAQYADDYRSEDGPAPSPDYDTDPDRLTADLRASLEVKE